MNLGDYKIGNKWVKLEDLMGVSLDSENGYTIQNKGYFVLQACSQETQPHEEKQGFYILTNQSFGYTKKTDTDFLWVKSYQKNTTIVVQEGL